jgi:hypothetical protein
MKKIPHLHAQNRNKPGNAALVNAAGYDIQNRRARRQQQHKGCKNKQGQTFKI